MTRRVLVTRAVEQAAGTADRLRARGYEVVTAPLLRIEPLPARIDPRAQAILVTSRNGAEALARTVSVRGLPVLAVGDATAAALHDAGFSDVHSADGDALALARLAAARLDPALGPVIHARGAKIRRSPLDALRETGFECGEAVLYRTLALSQMPQDVQTCDTALVYSPGSARRLRFAMADCRASLAIIAISDAALTPLRDAPFVTGFYAAAHPSEDAMIALLDRLPKNPVADRAPLR